MCRLNKQLHHVNVRSRAPIPSTQEPVRSSSRQSIPGIKFALNNRRPLSTQPSAELMKPVNQPDGGNSMTTMRKEKLVVVGTGMAAGRAVEEIVAREPGRFEITMFGAEPHTIYNRILLSEVLAGTKSPEGVFLYSTDWFDKNEIRLVGGAKVEAIDREHKTICCGDGAGTAYDKLIIATGSLPMVPAIENVSMPGVFVFRTINDCQLIAAYARRCRRAVVIGGGLLGIEAARGLIEHGLEITFVEVMPYPMAQQLDPESGAMLARRLESIGLKFMFEKATQRVLGSGAVRGLLFKDGAQIDTDMVVISCGIRPNVKLAVEAGLAVERGIVCDDHLLTSDPDIYAVGECVEHRGRLYGLVAPLFEQARVLADHITGAQPEAAYKGSRISTRLKVMGVDLVSVGDARETPDAVVTRYSEPQRGVYKKLVVREGKIAGAILLGEVDCAPGLIASYQADTPPPARHADLLFGVSSSADGDAGKIPVEAMVCSCHQVSKRTLVEQIAAGCGLQQLSANTKAGTGCGGCRPQIEALIGQYGGSQRDPAADYYVKSVPLAKPQLIAEIRQRGLKSVSAVIRELGSSNDDPASKPGLASLLRTIWRDEYEDERDARFINDRVHANIQNDGTFSVVPRIYGGVTSAQQLRRIADVAEKYQVRMVKITGGQRIDLLGVKKQDLPAIWRELGMTSGHAYTKAFRTCKTCVGQEFCRYGVGDSTALGIAIERRFQGVESPHKMKLAVSGCARNCAESTVKDVGVVAMPGGWQIHVGGAAGLRVRPADLLATVSTQEEVIKIIGRFIQYYRENARYAERSPAFVERVGIEKLRAILVDDAAGDAGRLDREIEAEVRAYRDPWQEGQQPYQPAQFAGQFQV
jgi:nitrite reductase (NADH) large subunit